MIKRKYRSIALLVTAIFPLLFLMGCAVSDMEQKSTADIESVPQEKPSSDDGAVAQTENIMRIKVSSETAEVVFELNDSSASRSFYAQLPLTVSVENYGDNEKIFSSPQKLNISNVWQGDCPTGSIAYFSPWNNIAMYYGDAPEYTGLYLMGKAVEGIENIGRLTGSVTITVAANA